MHPVFRIQTAQIQALDDSQARELLARLCQSQIERDGLDPAAVYWGGNQRAGDGGVDVRVDGRPSRALAGPLPRSAAIVQVKAEAFGPAKIASEMTPKSVLRPAIAALATNGGAYLIASTRDDLAEPRRLERIAAMEAVLTDHGLAGKIPVAFLGAREIANWVEQFPPLVIWVREGIGKPIQGWNAYGPWAYKETDQDAEFVVGKEPRVFGPGADEGAPDLAAIDAIRRNLAAGATVRLIGLSGVGKTRLAQVLFDPRIETDAPALSQDWAVYSDISNNPEPVPEAMIDALSGFSAPSILIIDNCGQKSHSALVERKAKVASSLGLLTIEYDIQDDLPEDTTFYRMEGASDETMSILLRKRFPQLSLSDVHTVIAASDGNSRLAFALASTSKHTDDLSSLKDGELFRRLFEQTQGAPDELLKCAKAASLIYSFDGEDIAPTSEIAILATFAGATPSEFRRNMIDLRRRGLLQERGKWRALLPHAVSNRLAALALEEHISQEFEDRLLTHAPARVRASFAHRLSFLHTSPVAQALVAKWLAPGEYFADPARLSDQDFAIFQRLAVVVPEAALAAVERFATSADPGRRHETDVDKLARLVQSIAYDASLFDRSIATLFNLRPYQSIDRKSDELTLEQIKPLFQLFYSETLAPGEQRAQFVERLLTSDDRGEMKVGLALLEEALKVRGFRPASQTHFGSRRRTAGWWPGNDEQYRQWYLLFIPIAERYAFRDDEVGAQVRAALGRGTYGYVQDEVLANHMEALAPRLIACDDWLPALRSLNELLRDKELDGRVRARAVAFKKLVFPKNLRARVHAAISIRNVMDEEEDGDDYESAEERATAGCERVGRELAADTHLLYELLPMLLSADAKQFTLSVGRGVALATPDAFELMDRIRIHILSSAKPGHLNSTFVFGLISGWSEASSAATTELLDSILDDEALGSWLPTLEVATKLSANSVQRIRKAIRIGRAPLWRYRDLASRLRSVSIADICSILDDLISQGTEGIHVGLDILQMVVFSAKDRSEAEQQALGRYCAALLSCTDWPSLDPDKDRLDYEIQDLIRFAAKHTADFDGIKGVLAKAVEARTQHPRYFPSSAGNFLSPIMRRYPQQALDYLFGLDDPQRRSALSDLVLEEGSVDASGKATYAISDDHLVQWCAADPLVRAPFAARICDLTRSETNGHPIARRLYDLAPDKGAVMLEFATRGSSAGNSERELPLLRQVSSIVSSLPTLPGSPEHETKATAIARIEGRIAMWNRLVGQTSRDRDLSFE